MSTIVISQPMYFPWPGFFELFACADIYVHLDDVQFADKSFTNRVQIKGPTASTWMTIPIRDRSARRKIMDIESVDDGWRRRHRELVRHALAKAPFIKDALKLMDDVLSTQRISDCLVASIEKPAAYLAINAPQSMRSSSLNVTSTGSQRILDIVLALGGTRYLTAHGAANYLDHEGFEAAGVAVDYIDYSLSQYPQLHGDFTPYVSVLDLIANMGPEAQRYLHPRGKSWRAFLAERAESN
jgi:hypothetical protein